MFAGDLLLVCWSCSAVADGGEALGGCTAFAADRAHVLEQLVFGELFAGLGEGSCCFAESAPVGLGEDGGDVVLEFGRGDADGGDVGKCFGEVFPEVSAGAAFLLQGGEDVGTVVRFARVTLQNHRAPPWLGIKYECGESSGFPPKKT